ncbi:MAG: anti-sigma factor [Burkholderiales bacterium]|jgi:anti-sigma-K factor RskA
MNYKDPIIRDRLAAEYVLGTMPARARRRFEAQLKLSPVLRGLVAEWEARLTPMSASMSGVTPPRRVWRGIQRRIHGDEALRSQPRWWNNLAFWRAATALASMAVLILGIVVGTAVPPPVAEKTLMVVVMDDMHTKAPAMTVSWEPGDDSKLMRLRVIGHAEMAPDTAWELWLLPGNSQTPVSLGLITTHKLQTLHVPASLATALDAAWGLGMTVEPAGGSPSGTPSNQMLYMGQCVKT